MTYDGLEGYQHIPDLAAYINYNAFTAKLTNLPREQRSDIVMFALLVHRKALEVSERSPRLSYDICAAAQWILLGGNTIFQTENSHIGEGWSRALGMQTELWKGPPGFNRERWNFWTERYSQMLTREDVSEEAKALARQAANEMTVIESNNDTTSS